MIARRARLLVCAGAFALTGCAAGSDSGIDSVEGRDVDRGSIASREDLATARAVWETEQPDGYRLVAEGTVDGEYVSAWITVDGDRLAVEETSFDRHATIDAMYDQIGSELDEGQAVSAHYDRSTGVILDLTIDRPGDDDVQLVVQEYDGVDRIVGCDAPSGTVTDLTAEPITYQLNAWSDRFSDADGCPVRLDSLSASPGPEHCNWESITFLGVDESINEVIGSAAGTFIHDPDDALDAFRIESKGWISIDQLPGTASATGFSIVESQTDGELWADSADPDSLYIVGSDVAAHFARDRAGEVGCM